MYFSWILQSQPALSVCSLAFCRGPEVYIVSESTIGELWETWGAGECIQGSVQESTVDWSNFLDSVCVLNLQSVKSMAAVIAAPFYYSLLLPHTHWWSCVVRKGYLVDSISQCREAKSSWSHDFFSKQENQFKKFLSSEFPT